MAVAEGECRVIAVLTVRDAVIVKVVVPSTQAEGPLRPILPRAG